MKPQSNRHPKFVHLVRELRGLLGSDSQIGPRAVAMGILELLCHACIEGARNGAIGVYSDDVIAELVDWRGQSSDLIRALVDTGWLERCDTHRLVLHNWEKHCPTYLRDAVAKDGGFATANTAASPINDSGDSQPTCGVECSFAEFWAKYPAHHRKRSRAACEKLFSALPRDSQRRVMRSVVNYRLSEPVKDGFVMAPLKWLDSGRWEDFEEVPRRGKAYPMSEDERAEWKRQKAILLTRKAEKNGAPR